MGCAYRIRKIEGLVEITRVRGDFIISYMDK